MYARSDTTARTRNRCVSVRADEALLRSSCRAAPLKHSYLHATYHVVFAHLQQQQQLLLEQVQNATNAGA